MQSINPEIYQKSLKLNKQTHADLSSISVVTVLQNTEKSNAGSLLLNIPPQKPKIICLF